MKNEAFLSTPASSLPAPKLHASACESMESRNEAHLIFHGTDPGHSAMAPGFARQHAGNRPLRGFIMCLNSSVGPARIINRSSKEHLITLFHGQ